MNVGHFKVSWRYNGPKINVPIIKKGRVVGVTETMDRVETTCVIIDKDDPLIPLVKDGVAIEKDGKPVLTEKILVAGIATRSIHDRPCNNKARIVSLGKALRKLYPESGPGNDKQNRAQFWAAYAELSPKRAWNVIKRQEKTLE